MNNLVEKMHKEYGIAHDHQKGLGADHDTCERFGLDAAAKVLLEAALGDVTER